MRQGNTPMTETPPARTPDETSLTLTQFMQPEHSNSLGNVHGGVILKLCDECGGIIAARHARHPCVTVTVDSVTFLQPVMLGRLLLVHGRITWVGRTSIEVEIRVEAENLLTGQVFHTNSAYFVYVALDDERNPAEVPPLLLETEEARTRFAQGEVRRQRRLERREQSK
ncbi:MAG: acyl-CoA thioesterase [Caldilineaceae bacterium]|nr:acyl-CoA thioesterase [Caldilineaceae bacterium]